MRISKAASGRESPNGLQENLPVVKFHGTFVVTLYVDAIDIL